MLGMLEASGGSCSISEIAARLGVSARTVYRYINQLQMVGFDVRLEKGEVRSRSEPAPESEAEPRGDPAYHIESSEPAMRRLAILSLLTGGPATLGRIVSYLADPVRAMAADERTIRRDLEHLESAGYVEAPGDSDTGYRLSGAFMPRFSLTFHELISVVRALESAPETVADPLTAASIRSKLFAAMAPYVDRAHAIRRRRYTKGRARRSDPAILARVEALEVASLESRVVRLGYTERLKGRRSVREVEPLGLVYYWFHDMWYLVAICCTARETRHFRVDRISGIVVTNRLFQYPSEFDLACYASGMWGVYAGEPTRVRVQFFDEMNVLARLRAEIADRPSACLSQVGTGVWELVDTVAGLPEFRVWLRSFGSSARVIEPECLRMQLIESAMRMRDMYNTAGCDIGDVKRSNGGGHDVDRR
jgi:predicted DNA-binding transcriptional regulator YafY